MEFFFLNGMIWKTLNSVMLNVTIDILGKDISAAGDKETLSQAKPTSLVTSPAQVKPLAGKVFYLDLPSNRTAETLERDIKLLGGVRQKHIFKSLSFILYQLH